MTPRVDNTTAGTNTFAANFLHGVDSDEDRNVIGEENHLFTPDELPTYVTEEEECVVSSATHKDADCILARDTVLEEESEEYQRGYMNAMFAHVTQNIVTMTICS